MLMGSKIDPAAAAMAVETATSKRQRPLESSSALAEVNPKRPCTDAGADTDVDGFEEFFALLQRIEATEKHCLRSRGAGRQEPAAKCVDAGKDDKAKAVTSQASWRPSFKWEDFSPGPGNRNRDVDSKDGDWNLKGRERVSPEASLDGERRLDLNLPSGLYPCD